MAFNLLPELPRALTCRPLRRDWDIKTTGTSDRRFNTGREGRCLHRRSKPAVIHVFPCMRADNHGDEYYYGLLSLHVPYRQESSLVCSFPHD